MDGHGPDSDDHDWEDIDDDPDDGHEFDNAD
jgi:hypothetical protein